MNPYQVWVLAALLAFSLGPLGLASWLANSVLAVFRRKRVRIALGLVALALTLASGWVPGWLLLSSGSEFLASPVSLREVLLLAYLHAGALAGIGVLVFGRSRAPQAGERIPGVHGASIRDLCAADRLLALHRERFPRDFRIRIPFNQVYRLHLREWRVRFPPSRGPSLHPDLEGLSILHLSDLHHGGYLVPEYFEAVREAVEAVAHDVLIVTGDFLDRHGRIDSLEEWLSRFPRRKESFAVLGNHDIHDHRIDDLIAALSRSGLRLIGGKVETIRRGGAALALAGLDYQNWWRPFPLAELRRLVPDGAFPVLATHTPCPFPAAARAGFPLVLCGHTHGGQVRLPGVGAVFIPARYGRRYQMGLYEDRGSYLHVHPGIGGAPAWRWACPPEFTRLVLTRKD